MARTVSPNAQAPRDPSFKTDDIAALRAIAQAAVDVELFTIPLYMTSLYSIRGSHEINDQYALYKGWTWPGAGPVAEPKPGNETAFNILFSIFIEEMLHLQMAANMATAVGVSPSFTSTSLQTPNHGWKCYGETVSIIPNIIDLTDTVLEEPGAKALNVPVNIGPLDATRLKLFLAIEQPDEQAREAIRPGARGKYFPKAPFQSWAPSQPLPMFGTIGHMYQCYYDYLHVAYTDGTTLWQAVFDPKAVQNDHFNRSPALPQYGFKLALDLGDSQTAFAEMCNMMDAITDQGEGSELDPLPASAEPVAEAVLEEYRALKPNLEKIYVTYNNEGVKQDESSDANARCDHDGADHYERFTALQDMLPKIETWATAGKAGNWEASDFVAQGGPWTNPHNLPAPSDLADAWNEIFHGEGCFEANYLLLSQACIGSIAGTTTVLEAYWKDPKKGFPGPAMGGTGDRMATIWAALGRAPNLSLGLDPLPENTLGHSCQAIDYNIQQGGQVNQCAAVQTFHSCIGSNNCHAEGGCGFVNKVTGGGSCSGGGGSGGGGSCSVAKGLAGGASGGRGGICGSPGAAAGKASCGAPVQGGESVGGGVSKMAAEVASPTTVGGASGGVCGAPQLYSGPGDNKCGGFGGCAVPISASQLYPPPPNGEAEAGMEVFDFQPGPQGYNSVKVGVITYKQGDKVDEVAYRAFHMVMGKRGVTVPDEMPAPTTLRLVFPPST